MRTNEYKIVKDDQYPNAIHAVMAVVISMLLTIGFTMMFGTAFDFDFSVWGVFFFSLIASAAFTGIHFANKKWLSAIALIAVPISVAGMVLINLFNLKDSLIAMIDYLQNYLYFLNVLPNLSGESTLKLGGALIFLNAYNSVAICFTTFFLIRRKCIPLSLLFYAPIFVMAVFNTTMLPDAAPSIITATGIILLILAHAVRNKDINYSGKLLAVLIVPVLIFSILLGIIFPTKNYDKYELATNLLNDIKDTASEWSGSLSEIFDTIIYGVDDPTLSKETSALFSLFPSSTNLNHVGPFNPSEEAILKVEKTRNTDYQGPYDTNQATALYLKVESMDEYKDNNLSSTKIKQKVFKDDFDPEPEEAPFKVKIKPVVEKWVDVVPYYTDFYVAGNKRYETVNPYNNTNEDHTNYAYSPYPVKVGDVYTDEYIEDYVYGTNLKVPKSTEMAIISSGALPDWYLDVYHGYVSMSDAEKVRRVTSYVSTLHPYSRDSAYPPKNVDFVAWFISDAETGICVHYAVTTVILLRLIGIPARYVRGYADSMSHVNTENYVYASSAHAWFEFFVPGYGWIMGDSTPGCAADASDFDINAVSRAYPEIEQASFARGYTSIFNPDYTSESTTESTEATTTTSESESETNEDVTPTPAETAPDDPTPSPMPDETSSSVDVFNVGSGTGDPSDPAEDFAVDFNKIPRAGSAFRFDNAPFKIIYEDETGLIVEIEASKVLDTINNIVLTLSIIALVIDLCIIGWYVYWRRHFSKKDTNGKAIAYYHYFEFMGRLFKYALPRRARQIAEKAAFSGEKTTPREVGALVESSSKDMKEIAKGFNKYKRFLFNILLIKVTNK